MKIDSSDAIAQLCRASQLLVAVDYDGTLADFSDDPMAATPRPGNAEALQGLAALPDTDVVVVSGRRMQDLRQLADFGPSVGLVGSHGAETDQGVDIDGAQTDLLSAIDIRVNELIADTPGAWVEKKPASRVVHVRQVHGAVQRTKILDLVRAHMHPVPGLYLTDGKDVLEISVVQITKGSWLKEARTDQQTVLFIGDDVTDESAMEVLTGTDVGVKVGPGDTAANCRLADTAAVTEFLRDLKDAREQARQ
ncbi:trehalose-phosphatase [Corynebacterium sp. TAE3-ERU12]|uniref:trehalose-phosphatase n=1 Tax=Corynebacterium sp. TAE3-ERU12 TaxID=2849491 RepID=UPI001C478C0B|nr:trehalose-phosphatase [Corynebacterium sp. TAE3-ERU12]